MLKFGRSAPFEEDIEKATSESNLTEDWSLIMHICDNVINYQDGAKFCLKAILKRLHHQVPRVVLQTLTLLDACVKNCDRRFLLQIASSEFTTEVKKLLSKMHPSAADKLKELIQKWSLEEFKDDPELCIIPSLYYELKSKGVDFSSTDEKKTPAAPVCTNPDAVSSQEEEEDIMKAIEISLKDTGRYSVAAEYGNTISYPTTEFSSKKVTEPLKVRTLYDFDAAEDNELTIKAGEIVMVLDSSNSSWWKGSNHRGEGLFPANFVTEDLEHKPDEVTAETTVTKEPIQDTSFVGEVRIDEEKIEKLINWLNYTDPAEEEPDPEDMLRLEDEVQKMGPLVEEQLQLVDKRLSMLNAVNEKIVTSLELFHSLSDSWSSTQPAMKYGTLAMTQPQVLPNMSVPGGFANMPFMPGHQIMFIPNPNASQPVPTNGISAMNNASPQVNPVSVQPQPPTMDSVLNTLSQTTMTETSASEQTSCASAAVSNTTSQGQVMNSYNPNVRGSYFVQANVPYPHQYPPNPQNMPPQAFIPASSSAANIMNMPYPIQAMGPTTYLPLPCYYMNSPVPPQVFSALTSAETPSQENLNMPPVMTAAKQISTTSASYPNVVQSINTATAASDAADQPPRCEQLEAMNGLSISNSNTQSDPIQVSK